MKVYDILVESKQVDEGPVRFLKRTLGKNTAMGKAAQLDVEIDKEVNSLFKDFYAVSKQDPKNKGMTAKGLANFLVGKGFVSSPKAVMAYINQDPGFARTAAKAMKKGKKAAGDAVDKVSSATKKGAAAVTKAAKSVKKKLSPEPSGMTPDPRQGELDLKASIYAEALEAYNEAKLLEVDLQLDKGQVKRVIKRFVQQGFQKQLGSRIGKSSYGDAPKAGTASKAKASEKLPTSKELSAARSMLQKAGYEVTRK